MTRCAEDVICYSAFFGYKSNEDDAHQAAHLSSLILTPSTMYKTIVMDRPRASTMSALPSFADHQAWCNDPRFDGSFPGRMPLFLCLGNLYVISLFICLILTANIHGLSL